MYNYCPKCHFGNLKHRTACQCCGHPLVESAEVPAIRAANDTYHGVMGIGGIGIYAENELPVIPSEAALERVKHMERTDIICRSNKGSAH